MRMRLAVGLAALGILSVGALARADAVVVTRAMTANTILEAFVEESAVRMELEIGPGDVDTLAALIEAKDVPGPVPTEAGLGVRADGKLLRGRIESRTTRKRVGRDEVSGAPLPKPSDEDVVFITLRYPLATKPAALVIEPPLNDRGYAAADIGFVVYHEGIAVNDFRYLAAGEPLQLDWEDPFYTRFERRTLNRKYGSPMNVFLYVEPFEVRKEVVVRPLDLARFTDLDVQPHEPIPADERDALLDAMARFLATRAPVTIDGEQPDPILDRIHFLKRGLRMTRVVTPDEPVDGTNAIVGAIFVYPVDGMPKEVGLDWDLFDDRVRRVPAAATDEAGPMPTYLTASDPELRWVNYLKGTGLPSELEVADLRTAVPLSALFLAAALASLFVFVAAARRRSWTLLVGGVALVAFGWLAPSPWTVGLPLPSGVATPPAQQAAPTIHALLYNVYRALDFRDEEVVFDRLSQSLSGDVLERVYLEMRKGLRLENQGGARVRVRDVRLLDLAPEDAPTPDTVRYRTRWTATGSVGHWGHTHLRTNAYDARLSLGELEGRWKIMDIEILEEARVLPGQP
jgi:hypothetical protein